LITVRPHLEPVPLAASGPRPIIPGLALFAPAHAFLYRWLSLGGRGILLCRSLLYGAVSGILRAV